MSVVLRIQHAAGRDVSLYRLLQGLPPAVEVITDSGDPPNPWRGYQKCLSDLPDSSHVCVLQDDTVACNNFAPALEMIAAANSDVPVVLFVSPEARRTAALMNQAQGNYVDLHGLDFMPVVAVLWPTHVAKAFMEWATKNHGRLPGGVRARSDDAVAGRWLRYAKQRVRCTVPSLIEHPDDMPSTIRRERRNQQVGKRVALRWIGTGDPLELDWS